MERQSERPVAIVTGAGRGIGRAIAIALARAGFALTIAARTREELEETRALTGLPARESLIVLIDLAQGEAAELLVNETAAHFGRIDVLVNNAGHAPPRTALEKMTAAEIGRVIAVNLTTPIQLCRAVIAKRSAAHEATIVNIASIAAREMRGGEVVYAGVKAALIAFSHALFGEVRELGIRVSVIVPGLTDTGLIPGNKRLDRSRMLRAEDVAAAVMQAVKAPAGACPIEIVLQPQRDPLRSR
jgi:NAD(P)-dependent dehydrogenase (short-subunit alcohol dehydrogenase family)